MNEIHKAGLREWLLPVFRTLTVVAGLGLALKILSAAGLVPAPAVGWNPDTGIMERQLLSVREAEGAQVVLLGDSTCLVGVDALQLCQELDGEPRVRNLALIIWLSLDEYAGVATAYANAHPGQTRTAVLLVCIPKVTGVYHDEAGEGIWRQIQGAGEKKNSWVEEMKSDWLGLGLLRRNVLSHVLATPLRRNAANYFGFSSRIQAYMQSHCGSVPAFGTVPTPRGKVSEILPLPPYQLSAAIEQESREFRKKLPGGTKVFIGLTPGRAGFSPPNERLRRDALLQEWNAWIGADNVLTNLPPTLPNIFFSDSSHLNQHGQKVFTRILARELNPLLAE